MTQDLESRKPPTTQHVRQKKASMTVARSIRETKILAIFLHSRKKFSEAEESGDSKIPLLLKDARQPDYRCTLKKTRRTPYDIDNNESEKTDKKAFRRMNSVYIVPYNDR
eukprot:scaffold2391_cov113-Cylindrotheca_fusiformis.AAC.5